VICFCVSILHFLSDFHTDNITKELCCKFYGMPCDMVLMCSTCNLF
jgi:hypothetical protein